MALDRGRLRLGDDDVLVVIDVQNGFMPGGTLPVLDGDQVVPVINRLAPAFELRPRSERSASQAPPTPSP